MPFGSIVNKILKTSDHKPEEVNVRKYNTGDVHAYIRTELTEELIYLYVAAI